MDWGFAGEMVQHDGRWYRSGTIGRRDYWRLGFTEVEWAEDGEFRIVRPSACAAEREIARPNKFGRGTQAVA